MTDPREEVARLTSCETPLLIGIRHHSPVCAAAVPGMLEAFEPETILLELPPEFQAWIPWLADPGLQAPVALAASDPSGRDLAFYPMADFSPELAAIRWAARHDVPVVAFDRGIGEGPRLGPRWTLPDTPGRGLLQALQRREDVAHFEALWERLIEARAIGATPEAVRAAGLMLGWALRVDALATEGIDAETLAREACMRDRLAATPGRVAAVVGSFHAAALLPEPALWQAPPAAEPGEATTPTTSLIPYGHALLDSRSGYPAGIRDPQWQQWVWEHAGDPPMLDAVLARTVSRVCAQLRRAGHVAGVPDALETVRVVRDLVRLRGLPGPGRRELLEAVQLTLGRGEPLGRGQLLARALEAELVGTNRGRLAPGTPRSGLGPHVEALLDALGLPGPESAIEPKVWHLDPWRTDLDRRRHVVLTRLAVCLIPYATLEDTEGLGAGEAITRHWTTVWTPSTAAMLEFAAARGATLEQATRGMLTTEERRLRAQERYDCAAELSLLQQSAEAGLVEVTHARLDALQGRFLEEASLPHLVAALILLERIARGHVPGLPTPEEASAPTLPGAVSGFEPRGHAVQRDALLAAALRSLSGLAGSADLDDARALVELIRLYQHTAHGLGGGRLGWAVEALARDGAPLMRGAGTAASRELDRIDAETFATRIGVWLTRDDTPALVLQGTLVVAGTRFETDPLVLGELVKRLNDLDDAAFMRRLPTLREAFDILGAGARQRVLGGVLAVLGDADGPSQWEDPPALLARWAAADLDARERLVRRGLLPPPSSGPAPTPVGPLALHPHAIAPADRWRLVLGRQRERLPPATWGVARGLDELYGRGRRGGLAPSEGGGQDSRYPSVREWREELDALFGADVREEIFGRAAEHGRSDVLPQLDPDEVTPSVELLQQVLSLRGSLGEGQLARLRPLVAKIIAQLVEALSQRLRPALGGLATSRPTARPVGPPDLRRTIRANLRTVRTDAMGRTQLVPDRMVFRTRMRRSLDWHLILVVDVSGSMEPSVIYSALMAAILSGLPALSVTFLAFNTKVIDMTEHVDDPLSLLLEVEIGGGTHIARAIATACARMTNPRRTMLVVLSDFEEGWPVGALVGQVHAAVETGARCLGLAALDDHGRPRCAQAIAERVAAAGMPVAALSPMQLARWVGEQIR